jgi:hypothetical protein
MLSLLISRGRSGRLEIELGRLGKVAFLNLGVREAEAVGRCKE